MITNERQFRITKSQRDRLHAAAAGFDVEEATRRTGSRILAEAELEALGSQASDLSDQLHEYEALKSGTVTLLKAKSLSELPTILIRGRIAKGLSQHDLAEKLGLKEQQIQRYEAEGYRSASLRRLAEVADALTLNVTEVAEFIDTNQRKKLSEAESIDWNLFPVREMYKRNWFQGFSGSLTEAQANAEPLLQQFVTKAIRRPLVALNRKRIRLGSVVDPYSLLAWHCRVLLLARDIPLERSYKPEFITNAWLSQLVRHSRSSQGPILAKTHLENAGIPLIVEPHLPGTHLDGAALLDERGPVIGVTLRHDRLDNFWFVLLHELIHVKEHLQKGQVEQIFDDLEAEPDELERQADALAGEALIPDNIWDTALARYTRSEQSIKGLADDLEISPAIVAGRIRNEANNYVILNNLVGHGEVRKLFPFVRFGY